MDNGFVFLLGLFSFFFVLWFIGGGPQKPISSAGVYITPATTTADTQQGYGPKPNVDVNISLPGKGSVSVKTKDAEVEAASLTIARTTQQSSENPNQTYLEFTVTSHSTTKVNLKGWRLVSSTLQSASLFTTDVAVEPGKTILVITNFPNSSAHDTMELINTNGTIIAATSY